MSRKYPLLVGIIIATILLVAAIKYYPVGAQNDKNSTGYEWKSNYLGKLLNNITITQLDNPSRLCAICGIFYLLNQ